MCSSTEPVVSSAPAAKNEGSGLRGIFGAMAAVLVVVAAFYSVRVVFLCTASLGKISHTAPFAQIMLLALSIRTLF
jgi:hypothetical protein